MAKSLLPEGTNLDEIENELQRGLNTFKAFQNAQKVVELVRTLDQSTREAEKRKKQAEQDAEAALNSAAASIKDAEDRRLAAEEKVKGVLANGRREADKIREDAQQQVSDILQAAKERRAEMDKENDQLQVELEDKQLTLKEVSEMLQERKQHLADLEERIAAIVRATKGGKD